MKKTNAFIHPRRRKALILGATGQDAAYLARHLLNLNYEVYATTRRSSPQTGLWRLAYLNLLDKVNILPADITDQPSLLNAIKTVWPDEIYVLAAMSFVQASFQLPQTTLNTDGGGVLNVLESALSLRSPAKIYLALSSEMWGNNTREKNDENAPHLPASPYAASKVFAYHLGRIYREAYGMFVVHGHLTNHDSPIRSLEFVSRRITNYIGRLVTGETKEKLKLGNVTAVRDFGYSPEFMDAAWRMLQQDTPDDFVIATGVGHSVAQFAEKAFGYIQEDWKDHVEVNTQSQLRPLDVQRLVGDPTKAREMLNWHHQVSFDELVEIMVREDIRRWQAYKQKKVFPWDVLP